MSDIRDKVVADCIKRLEAVGCLYHIMDHNGDEHGFALVRPTLPDQVKHEEKPRRVIDRRAGHERTKHVLPYLIQLVPGGDPISVPLGEFTMEEIQSTVGTRMLAAFGASNYTTTRNRVDSTVEVLLIANENTMGVPQALAKSFGTRGEIVQWVEELLEHHAVVSKAAESQDIPQKKSA